MPDGILTVFKNKNEEERADSPYVLVTHVERSFEQKFEIHPI